MPMNCLIREKPNVPLLDQETWDRWLRFRIHLGLAAVSLGLLAIFTIPAVVVNARLGDAFLHSKNAFIALAVMVILNACLLGYLVFIVQDTFAITSIVHVPPRKVVIGVLWVDIFAVFFMIFTMVGVVVAGSKVAIHDQTQDSATGLSYDDHMGLRDASIAVGSTTIALTAWYWAALLNITRCMAEINRVIVELAMANHNTEGLNIRF